jgi:hypothetical protein
LHSNIEGGPVNNWLEIRVELVHGRGIDLDPPPGRIFIVDPKHTFDVLARAIDQSFARWDLSHLHVFELSNGSQIGMAGDDLDTEFENETEIAIATAIGKSDEFTYVFDFGDDWTHMCTVQRDDVDPAKEFGDLPAGIVPIWGWGSIPDQYGRETSSD